MRINNIPPQWVAVPAAALCVVLLAVWCLL